MLKQSLLRVKFLPMLKKYPHSFALTNSLLNINLPKSTTGDHIQRCNGSIHGAVIPQV